MRKFLLSLILIGLPVAARAVPTPIYPILNDNGIAGDDIYIWNGTSVSLDSATVSPAPPEGLHSMKAVMTGTGATWAIMYLTTTTTPITNRSVDLSVYSNGEIRLWLNCDSDQFQIDIQHADGSSDGYYFGGALTGLLNQWVSVVLPLGPIAQSFPINDIVSPFKMTSTQIAPFTCYIDEVRYVNPTTPTDPTTGTAYPIFVAKLRDTVTQGPALGGFTWPNPAPLTGWARANQYIDLEIDDPNNFANWGVQIYTDNRNAGANPQYIVTGSSNPAGLVDISNRSLTIPLAWSVKAATFTVTAGTNVYVSPPVAAEPNAGGADTNSYQWIYMKDAQTPDIPTENTTAFDAGETAVTVRNHLGIHFGQAPSEFGAQSSPNYIFIEANLGTGLANRTYRTNRLIVEYFTL